MESGKLRLTTWPQKGQFLSSCFWIGASAKRQFYQMPTQEKEVFIAQELNYYRDNDVIIHGSADHYVKEIDFFRQDPENLIMPIEELLQYVIM